jgi:hypothetical protein
MNAFVLIIPLEDSFMYAHAYGLVEARRCYFPKLSTNYCMYVPVAVSFNNILHTRCIETKGGRQKERNVKLSLVLN